MKGLIGILEDGGLFRVSTGRYVKSFRIDLRKHEVIVHKYQIFVYRKGVRA